MIDKVGKIKYHTHTQKLLTLHFRLALKTEKADEIMKFQNN